MTARDIQKKHIEKGLPWEIAKAFDDSAILGDFIDLKNSEDLNNLAFSLKKNGEMVQNGNTKNMVFDIDTIIAYCSIYFTLEPGDLIFTGTPAGVGAIQGWRHTNGIYQRQKSIGNPCSMNLFSRFFLSLFFWPQSLLTIQGHRNIPRILWLH